MRDDFPWGWACAIAIGVVVIVMIGGAGGGTTTNTNSHNNNRTQVHVASDNHIASDNKVNLWGTIQDCNGPGSCTTVIVTNTVTVRDGEAGGNVVLGSDGTPLCEGADGIFRTCEAQP
jgi:hypothetical protein